MMTKNRSEILRLLGEISEMTPDVRFGQLIANLSYLAVAPTAEAIWEMEDDELITALKKHLSDLSNRHAVVA
ncbi:MAG: hypothetical protein U0798_00300 [Gemmataceae bacterium]